MMDKKNKIHLSTKSLLILSCSLLILVSTIIFLGFINESRKFKQFQNLNHSTINSVHLSELKLLTSNFDIYDSEMIERLKGKLNLMVKDIHDLNHCYLIIPNEYGTYYKVKSYSSTIETINYPSAQLKELMSILKIKDSKSKEKEIYKILNDEPYQLKTIVNLDSSYLFATKNRKY